MTIPVVEQILAAERGGQGQIVVGHEAGQRGAGLVIPAGAAGDDQRTPGGGQQAAQFGKIGGIRRGAGDAHRRHIDGHTGAEQHVFRQPDHHWAGAAGLRHAEGAGHNLGNAFEAVNLGDPLGDAAEHLAVVDLLEGFAAAEGAVDLPDEQDHRRRILPRRVHAVGRVGGARAAGDEADAGPAAELATGVGHVGGGAFVAGDDSADGRVRVECVEHRQVALAGHAVDRIDAVAGEGIDQDLAAVTGEDGRGHQCGLRLIWRRRAGARRPGGWRGAPHGDG